MRASSLLAAAIIAGVAAQSASADSLVTIEFAGEAYGGAPAFQLRLGDRIIGEGVAEKAIDTRREGRLFGVTTVGAYLERFEFPIEDPDFDPTAPVSIILTNDRYVHIGDGYDRNLFIGNITVNGMVRSGHDIKIIEYGSVEVDVPLHEGLRPLYGSGQVAVAAPPPAGWPAGIESETDVAIVPIPIARPAGF